MKGLEELLAAWDGETTVVRRDRESGGWMFVCIHSTRRGPAGGGTRLKVYPSPAEALQDAMRLSAAMTRKLAIADLPFGGGKGVIAVAKIPEGQRRRELFLRYGDLIASLGGSYRTSSDMNTGERDMDVIGERTEYVFGRSVAAGGAGDPAPPTAIGVLHGIRASLAEVFGSDQPAGRRVVVQGVGGVGSALARHLAQARSRVLIADLDADRAASVAARVGGDVVAPSAVIETECDVFAPCAAGGVLTTEAASRIRARIVAGSANNQLAEPEAAEILHSRGVLYAPDYVINAGGALALVGLEQLGWGEAELAAGLAGIGETLREVYRRCSADGVSTSTAAEELAERRVAEGAPR